MKKSRYWMAGLLALVLIIGIAGIGFFRSTPTNPKSTTSVHQPPAKTVAPITKSAWAKQPKLKYASIIYYAVHHLKIQRWQEVSDFELGWQVEIYPNDGHPKYLVWPDAHIQADAKQLQPNWFTITASGQVTYDSFTVHSFRQDQTATVGTDQILAQLRKDHAAKKVHAMVAHLSVVHHH